MVITSRRTDASQARRRLAEIEAQNDARASRRGHSSTAGSRLGMDASNRLSSTTLGEERLRGDLRQYGALLVANGTSCRHQIADGTGRRALHVAQVLDAATAGQGT